MKKVIVFMMAVLMMGCQSSTFLANTNDIPSRELSEFMPETLSEFVGDGGYFHQYHNIEDQSTEGLNQRRINGEVKNTSFVNDQSRLKFEVLFWIDSEKWVQEADYSLLNDSQWNRLVILKEPLVEGNQWIFRTQNALGKSVKVEAMIKEVSHDKSRITVEYSGSDGSFEKRTLQKGMGTVTFSKKLIYKSATTYTGYQYSGESYSTKEVTIEESFEQMVSVQLPERMMDLITTFNRVWAEKNQNPNLDLFPWIEMDSLAYEKIIATQWRSDLVLTMLEIKPFKYEAYESYFKVYTFEAYKTKERERFINTIVYTLVPYKDTYLIRDFEAITYEP